MTSQATNASRALIELVRPPAGSIRLRIWGSEVRILSGAPIKSGTYRGAQSLGNRPRDRQETSKAGVGKAPLTACNSLSISRIPFVVVRGVEHHQHQPALGGTDRAAECK